MPHFGDFGGSEHASIFGIVEKSSSFGFGGRGEDHFHDTTKDVNSTSIVVG